MSVFDIAVVAFIVLSGLFAFARGFVKEALSIAAWLGATFAAFRAFPWAEGIAERVLPAGPAADVSAALGVFLVVLFVLSFITSRIARFVRASALSPLDRTLGLIFGLGRGGLLVCLAFIALSWLLPKGEQQPRWLAEARTLPLIETGAEAMKHLLPEKFRARATASATAGAASVENEVRGAISALSQPRPPAAAAPAGAPQPRYTNDDQRGLNRLIEQTGR